jgi:hypothetical protein
MCQFIPRLLRIEKKEHHLSGASNLLGCAEEFINTVTRDKT